MISKRIQSASQIALATVFFTSTAQPSAASQANISQLVAPSVMKVTANQLKVELPGFEKSHINTPTGAYPAESDSVGQYLQKQVTENENKAKFYDSVAKVSGIAAVVLTGATAFAFRIYRRSAKELRRLEQLYTRDEFK